MFDIHTIMKSLARSRPIFHSEADFQQSLAWEIRSRVPGAEPRLEYPSPLPQNAQHIDIWVLLEGEIAAIELKYIPRKLPQPVEINGEKFNPKSGAGGRLGLIKDIRRLEQLVGRARLGSSQITGFAILLTSYSPYWQPVKKSVPAYVDLHENLELHGPYKDGKEGVTLKGRYVVQWRDYNSEAISKGRYGFYRYLAIEVVRVFS